MSIHSTYVIPPILKTLFFSIIWIACLRTVRLTPNCGHVIWQPKKSRYRRFDQEKIMIPLRGNKRYITSPLSSYGTFAEVHKATGCWTVVPNPDSVVCLSASSFDPLEFFPSQIVLALSYPSIARLLLLVVVFEVCIVLTVH